jgi:hypothetical protein
MMIATALEPLHDIGCRWGTDKGTVHSYLEIYDGLLGHLRDEPITLLEIGMGWSAFMWLEYFPRARVHVIDKDRPHSAPEGARLKFHVMRQEDETALARLQDERFDIIIDDGSHEPAHQLLTCHALWGCLNDGGYYFVEDLPRLDCLRYWEMMPGYQAWTPLKGGRFDDILVMLRK